jgi:ribosomal 30S subunit maturation factor RimM
MTNPINTMSGAPVIAVPASSSGGPQAWDSLKVDRQHLAAGYRVSEIVGRTVVNGSDETIGEIEDLMIGSHENVPSVELSVGGFLGIGAKHVIVPYSALAIHDKQMLYRGVTKESLEILPDALPSLGGRTSKVIGADVVNGDDETIGTVDDLIVTPSENIPYAVLSVGGFLGIGKKRVVIPFSALEPHDEQLSLIGATKESLKNLPEFDYDN